MNTLASAYWGEGISDQRFLPVLIQRTLEEIMLECSHGEWDVIEPILLHPQRNTTGFVEQILDLSRQANGFHLLFVHIDADAPNEEIKALPNKIHPALEALEALLPNNEYCHELVPIIPVVKIENWKLADTNALREALGTDLDDQNLGLNIGSKVLEQRSTSKELLSDVLNLANYGRRAPVELQDLDAALAKGISLKRIYRFSSFQKFVDRLKTSLIQQNIIEVGCIPKFIN